MSIGSMMPPNHLIFCHTLLLPSVFPRIRIFSSELTLHIMWPKFWSFTFSISPFNEYSGLISFRIDWFDLLVAQETLKNLLHQHNSKTWILWHSTFFMVQLSHPYMTTRKTIALIIQASVCKVMSLIWLRANHRKRRWQRRLIEVVRKRGGKAELSSVMEIRETATQEEGGSSQCSWDAKRKTGCQIAAGWELKEWSILSSLTIKKF